MENYRFDHVHIYSPNPARTAAFYEKTFGAENYGVRGEEGGRMIADLVLHGIDIKISTPWDPNDKDSYGLDHFGMITDNLDAAIAELKGQGIKFVMEKTPVPNANISFFLTPEDVLIELVEKTG